MTRPALRTLFWFILLGTALIFLNGMVGCSAPVVINKAVPSKAVNTEPIRKAVSDARESVKKADKKAEEEAQNLKEISLAIPKAGASLTLPAYDLLMDDIKAAAAEVEEQRKDLYSAQESMATALEQRAAVQEVADNLHVQNVALSSALNTAKESVATLSAKVASASARGALYLKLLIGIVLIDAAYAVAKFYFHIPI